MLHVHHGNRTEVLADRLAELLAQAPGHPLQPQVVMVQNPGMAHWLSLAIAARRGVAANLDFPLPGNFIWRVFQAQWPGLPKHSAFDCSVLSWRILALLPRLCGEDGCADLDHYLRDDDPMRAYQLACRIAQVFDRYLVYRPHWLLAWEQGEGEHWQARLWRLLVADVQYPHRAQLLARFHGHCEAGLLTTQGLPPCVSAFGLSMLAPAYVGVLARLAERLDVHLFLLNPSDAYWGDLEDERMLARRRARWRQRGMTDASAYYAQGHPLLAAWGRQVREFFDLLLDWNADDHPHFQAPAADSLLGRLQADMLQLDPQAPAAMFEPDTSIQFHACHSPLREVQVLHDQLLALFEQDPDLSPHDVVVMAPDIESYAPYVDAVFATAPDARRIPWTIADRPQGASHPLCQACLMLLDLPESRLPVSEILTLLELPAVSARFELDAEELLQARRAIIEGGVRWGLDEEDRRTLGLGALSHNTWRFGLMRMLLGYALGGDDATDYAGVLPYAAVGRGAQAAWIGQLAQFVEALAELRSALRGPHPPQIWQQVINQLLALFQPQDEEDSQVLEGLREVMANWLRQLVCAGYEQTVERGVLKSYLRAHLAEPAGTRHFMTGAVTFCALQPMRSIPFRVVCLLGMNEGEFPRRQHPLGFDLMAAKPRPGDRHPRDEDRQLFLEALLSARQVFYLSYVGRSIRDNSLRLPSVLISELLDVLGRYVGEAQAKALTIQHPMQPFSACYQAQAPRLFTYAAEWFERTPMPAGGPFAATALTAAPVAELSLDQLRRCLAHPVQYFLQERLGVYFQREVAPPVDEELFKLDGLTRYQLRQQLLTRRLAAADPQRERVWLISGGGLPYGIFGELAYERLAAEVDVFIAKLSKLPVADHLARPLEVDLALPQMRLTGWLARLTPQGLFDYRLGKIRAKHRLALWLEHLVLNALAPPGVARCSHFLGEEGGLRLAPVDDPLPHLHELAQLYQLSLSRPLPLFLETSYAYACNLRKNGDEDKARQAAGKRWWTDEYRKVLGEREDPFHDTAFRGRQPLEEPEFAELALRVFDPLLAVTQEWTP